MADNDNLPETADEEKVIRIDSGEAVDEPADGELTGEQITATTPLETKRILEALLFASEDVLSPVKIKSILPGEPDAREIKKMIQEINGQLSKERHPFEIIEVAGGFQFRTIAYYSPWVRQLLKEKAAKRLSVQALESLAIIAYKQPITKAEIEAIRGVVTDGAIKTLLERRLVSIDGRSDKPGRPLLYSTTREFLVYFGLKAIADLPKIEEFEALAKEKMSDLEQELAQMNLERQQENGESGAVPAETAPSDVPDHRRPLSELMPEEGAPAPQDPALDEEGAPGQ
jgi:segregation and condensation protein B